MNTGLSMWFRRQSVMALPGALAALLLRDDPAAMGLEPVGGRDSWLSKVA